MPTISARVLRSLLMTACAAVGFGLVMIGVRVPFALILMGLGIAWQTARRSVGSGWSFGTARVASFMDLIRNRLLGDAGLILGTTGIMPRPSWKQGLSALWSSAYPAELACRLFLLALGGRKWAGDRMIRINDFVHLATFAPTGRGKSLYVLIANLLSYRRSCVITDPKGELFDATAYVRQERLGQRIVLLDPFFVCDIGSDKLNPLDCIDDQAPDFLDQCRDLANMMIVRSGTETDPHWNDSAELVLTAFIAFVCACEIMPVHRNLGGVRAMISARDSYTQSIAVMQLVTSHDGVIKRLGEQLTWFADKELGSVMSTLQRQTAWLDSPLIARNMASSSFSPMVLRTERASVYLVLPHDKLETLAPLMRIWIGVILRTITRGKPSEYNHVLFYLDEAAHLGRIRVLENAVTLMRGMGVRLWFFFQSVHQVQECYGEKAKTFLDNIDTQQYFGTNSYEAAEELSKRIGDATISLVSHGQNDGRSYPTGGGGKEGGSYSTGRNSNVSETGRRKYKAEEILMFPKEVALIFHRNVPVILSWLVPYFQCPEFRNHGTGDQAGLGRVATEKSVALLLAALLFAAFAAMLPPVDPGPKRQPRRHPIAERRESDSGQTLSTELDPFAPAPSGWQFFPW